MADARVSSLAETEVKSVSTEVTPVEEPITNVSILAVPSKYKSLNSKEPVPKSISLSVTGLSLENHLPRK